MGTVSDAGGLKQIEQTGPLDGKGVYVLFRNGLLLCWNQVLTWRWSWSGPEHALVQNIAKRWPFWDLIENITSNLIGINSGVYLVGENLVGENLVSDCCTTCNTLWCRLVKCRKCRETRQCPTWSAWQRPHLSMAHNAVADAPSSAARSNFQSLKRCGTWWPSTGIAICQTTNWDWHSSQGNSSRSGHTQGLPWWHHSWHPPLLGVYFLMNTPNIRLYPASVYPWLICTHGALMRKKNHLGNHWRCDPKAQVSACADPQELICVLDPSH